MLELERALAEYQRREETRKERMESRLRALEGTLAALQRRIAQLNPDSAAGATEETGLVVKIKVAGSSHFC